MMKLIELGYFSLIVACCLSCVQSLVFWFAAKRKDHFFLQIGIYCVIFCFILTFFSFISLLISHLHSDFSVINVWKNSHTLEPFLYKLSGTWGNHEGSMLLCVLILSFLNCISVFFSRSSFYRFYAYVSSLQSLIFFSFVLFIFLESNPFLQLGFIPEEGKELNPILQDIGLLIHPPLLYFGYMGFSFCFSAAVIALIEEKIESIFLFWILFWSRLSWIFLTAGITMGSYWAYYELGWGGFWFWDPVENLAFIPWLTATALLHSLAIMQKKKILTIWVILLSILTFAFCLLGLFSVRSGILVSVHSFTENPERGIFLLFIFFFFVGAALFLFGKNAHFFTKDVMVRPISREGFLLMNNLLLCTGAATVFIGTFYPVFLEMFIGKKISVGSPFFGITFIPLMVPLLILLPIGPYMYWNKDKISGIFLLVLFLTFSLLYFIFIILFPNKDFFILLLLTLAIWAILGSFFLFFWHQKRIIIVFSSFFSGTIWAHLGVGIIALGMIGATFFDDERVLVWKPSETIEIAGYHITFDKIERIYNANYMEYRGCFRLASSDIALYTSRRFYSASEIMTTEPGIKNVGFSHVYISLGERYKDSFIVRVSIKPMVTLIWMGGVCMIVGGMLLLAYEKKRKRLLI